MMWPFIASIFCLTASGELISKGYREESNRAFAIGVIMFLAGCYFTIALVGKCAA